MADALFDSLRPLLRGKLLAAEPMARHTTWRVGGAAEVLAVPADREELLTLLDRLRRWGVPWLLLGAGSNLLVRDGGLKGAVIQLGAFRRLEFGEDGTVRAGGGLPLMALVRASAERGLTGLEDLAGIPGTVGGAAVMNAGAAGTEMADVVEAVETVDAGGWERLPAAALGFGYRRSSLDGSRAVIEAVLKLGQEEAGAARSRIEQRLAERRAGQGVGAPNAGSVFRNPPGGSAWRLIDEAGFRGRAVGAARVSPKHANFIVNEGSATAADILELMAQIREAVLTRHGVLLEPEVRIVGEEA